MNAANNIRTQSPFLFWLTLWIALIAGSTACTVKIFGNPPTSGFNKNNTLSGLNLSEPTLSYSSASGTHGTAMTLTPTLDAGTGATVSNCVIASGTLPSGLSINNSTCVISGTPTAALASTAYTVTITNSFGQQATSASFNLSVAEQWADDSNNSTSGFAAGIHTGSAWDATNATLRLTQTGTPTNQSELESSWTPRWANLISYWKLNQASWDGSANEILDSKGTNHGVAQNGASTSASLNKLGAYAGTFDGVDDHALFPQVIPATFTALTIAGWIRPTAASAHTLFNQGGSTANNGSLRMLYEGRNGVALPENSITLNRNNSGAVVDTSSTAYSFPLNAWSHFAVTIAIDGTCKLYANGVQSGSAGACGTGDYAADVAYWGAYAGAGGWGGQMDELAIWSTALSASEVNQIYSRQSARYAGTFQSRVFDFLSANTRWDGLKWTTPLPFGKELPGDADNDGDSDGDDSEKSANYSAISTDALMNDLVGLWRLNESSGTSGANSVADASGNASHATPNGSVSFGEYGQFASSAKFSGGRVDAGSPAVLDDLSALSVSAWIRPSSAGTSGAIATKFNNGNCDGGWCLNLGTSEQISFKASHATTLLVKTTAASTITYNRWAHVLVTWDGSTDAGNVHIYIDGIEPTYQTTTNGAGARTSDAARSLIIGNRSDNGQSFDGYIDEVGVWGRVLTSSEISEVYRRGSNRIKFQIRACTAADCSDEPTWLGANGSNLPLTTFSELHNNLSKSPTGDPLGRVLISLPELLFNTFNNLNVPNYRYIQYRSILESDDLGTSCDYGSGPTWCSPELVKVEISP